MILPLKIEADDNGTLLVTCPVLRSVAGFLQASERFASFMIVNATWQIVRAGCIFALIVAGLPVYHFAFARRDRRV